MGRLIAMWAGLCLMAAGTITMVQAINTPGSNTGAEGTATVCVVLGYVLLWAARRRKGK